jgi:hypothetical protein
MSEKKSENNSADILGPSSGSLAPATITTPGPGSAAAHRDDIALESKHIRPAIPDIKTQLAIQATKHGKNSQKPKAQTARNATKQRTAAHHAKLNAHKPGKTLLSSPCHTPHSPRVRRSKARPQRRLPKWDVFGKQKQLLRAELMTLRRNSDHMKATVHEQEEIVRRGQETLRSMHEAETRLAEREVQQKERLKTVQKQYDEVRTERVRVKHNIEFVLQRQWNKVQREAFKAERRMNEEVTQRNTIASRLETLRVRVTGFAAEQHTEDERWAAEKYDIDMESNELRAQLEDMMVQLDGALLLARERMAQLRPSGSNMNWLFDTTQASPGHSTQVQANSRPIAITDESSGDTIST